MKRTLTILALAGLSWSLWAQDPVEQFMEDKDHIAADIDLYNFDDMEYRTTADWDNRQTLQVEDLEIELFPMPVTDQLIVRLLCACDFNNVRITLLDHNGMQVFGMRGDVMHEGIKRLVIPFNDLPRGNYYLLIHYEGGVTTRKVVKA
ncbi:MAG: hypothetical protein ABR95_03865 [Sphingobacteriales bacterium BACL12 MAG-120813-bin55]|jgi:hypothetical protein|nr:MAG: hypothetical protein ABR94_01385 [Sphingobacteriales bacterium BACL12 MAG-120802-bin5]KRP10565.1 MAG: hypothetical protein ABR95_03865 [Sphingobacteriales bacterium BACL12 MAG-120813-bin55]